MKLRSVLVLATLGTILIVQPAWANAGTPLMWAGMLHLTIGNALIGLLEGLLLGWLFGASKSKAVAVMIVANYVSAWLGGNFLRLAIVKSLPMDLTNAWMWFWVMVGATYCLTLVLEWPFVACVLRPAPRWLTRSLWASLVVQSTSYLILCGWYWMASGTSLYTEMHIVASGDISLPDSVLVYFIDPADGNVYRRHLAGGRNEQKICELHSAHKNDRLLIRPSAEVENRWDLIARLETDDHRDPTIVDVRTNMHIVVATGRRDVAVDSLPYTGTWFNFGDVPSLGGETSQWEFWTGFWPVEGLRATNRYTNEHVHFSYETPFGAWTVRNAVRVSAETVLFQLGEDQICAFDAVTRQVALLWHGRGPVPVVELGAVEPHGGPDSR